MTVSLKAPIERLAFTPSEAAASLGCGETLFRAEFLPHLRVVRAGRKVLIPVSELQRLLDERAEESMAAQIAA